MPSYKLIYFNSKGRAEPIRMAFLLADVKFTDERLEGEDWLNLKPKTPQGKLPVLDIDGKMIPQSNAILNYVGREFDLKGEDNMEKTQVDVVLATLDEVFQSLGKIFDEKDETKKNEIREEFRKTSVPRFFGIFRKMLEDNSTGSGWLVGSKITIADLAWFQCSEFVQILSSHPEKKLEEDLFKGEDKLLAHRQKVCEVKQIKNHLATRPDTKF